MNFFNLASLAGTSGTDALGVMAILAGLGIIAFLMIIPVYVYMALTMMFTAKKLQTTHAWLAWIPIANTVLFAKMAKMHWWPILLLATAFISWIPVVGMIIYGIALLGFYIYTIIWSYRICEFRSKPGWWAILTIIPILGWVWAFVMWGILAWGK